MFRRSLHDTRRLQYTSETGIALKTLLVALIYWYGVVVGQCRIGTGILTSAFTIALTTKGCNDSLRQEAQPNFGGIA